MPLDKQHACISKHSKKSPVCIPSEQSQTTCAKSIGIIGVTCSYSPSNNIMLQYSNYPPYTNSLIYGIELAELISNKINSNLPGYALADIERCENADQTCQSFEVNIFKKFGSTAEPFTSISQGDIAGLSGASVITDILGGNRVFSCCSFIHAFSWKYCS